ncbi:MAG: Flp family type IVb pilin [Anaerolineales bacterium]
MLTKWYLYVKNWIDEQEGQDLIEYALIIVLLVVVAVVGLNALGVEVSGIWTKIKDWLDGTVPAAPAA